MKCKTVKQQKQQNVEVTLFFTKSLIDFVGSHPCPDEQISQSNIFSMKYRRLMMIQL
mgnify:CR=1 FL=1